MVTRTMTSVFGQASGVYGAFGAVLFLSLVCFASASLRSTDMTTAQYLVLYCFWPMAALVVLGLFVYGMVVTIRVMWDPVYCSMIATSSDIHIAFSHPIRQIGPSVHVSEHNIDCGHGHCGCFHGRDITKFSRMIIVEDPATKTLCLFNPCPLTDAVRAALDALGQVKVVVVNNCFHYLFAVQYCDAYGPLGARVLVPSSLLVKCPALKEKGAVRTLPSAQEGSIFPGTQYFRVPNFFAQEHVIFIPAAGLLYCADTLVASLPDYTPKDHGLYTPIELMNRFLRCISLSGSCHCGTPPKVRYMDYIRCYFPASAQAETAAFWRRVLALPITRVVTGHGLYDGSCVEVTRADLDGLCAEIAKPDDCWDHLGRGVFQLLVRRRWGFSGYPEWNSLFDIECPVHVEEDVLGQPTTFHL